MKVWFTAVLMTAHVCLYTCQSAAQESSDLQLKQEREQLRQEMQLGRDDIRKEGFSASNNPFQQKLQERQVRLEEQLRLQEQQRQLMATDANRRFDLMKERQETQVKAQETSRAAAIKQQERDDQQRLTQKKLPMKAQTGSG